VIPAGGEWAAGCGGLGDGTGLLVELLVTGPDGHVMARLYADGYEPSAEDTRDWTFVTPNLAVPREH
jgi:hypothetical protein